jgi:hypothetical protein
MLMRDAVALWCFQVQLLMQIIINRIGLLIALPSTTALLRWGAFIIILIINISVFVIWIPAQLQISDSWININAIWDRIEKCIFLVIDASLNLLFVYLVRTRLIANGLTKYWVLFRANLAMIALSISLDIVLVGLMSLPNHIVYLQFQCAAYITKLHIEMNMADLIRKVVTASNDMDYCLTNSNMQNRKKGPSWPRRSSKMFIDTISRGANHNDNDTRHSVHVEHSSQVDLTATSSKLEALEPPISGIKKTVRTEISISRRGDDEDGLYSDSDSTRHVQIFRQGSIA